MQPEEDLAPSEHLSAEERDPEAPAADAVEQATMANPADQDTEIRRGFEVDEWDAMEQARVIDLDDDYR
ncbi:hypothetical protein SAMN05444365_1011131 [Micromonospora pattaloongensis]|uniref:Uncharacterized protein n=1 Tax=Micromonospora pattaloongensis TaxID=405436 RepID=A0A1H3I7K0_9ACTN|nr:hypothetical protein [Micromonospora pattaloongensis]SDY22904.1 hypothetical protein SAMN05444365_1011131 [Micromonospora pattaloongensis]